MISSEFFRKPCQIIRKSEGGYTDGKWVVGEETTIDIIASVQPLSKQQIQLFSEGRSSTEMYAVFTNFELQTVKEDNPDVFLCRGNRYEVLTCEPHQSGVIDHYKAVISKVATNANL